MSYQSARSLEIRDAHARRIEDFAREYRRRRPTIVFLPGGMGSQLDQSDKPYRDDTSIPFQGYDPVWIDLGLVFGQDAIQLEIRPDSRDRGSHIVVPNGPLRFLIKPYDGTESYFREREINFITFGFDWRRPLSESAAFLKTFLNLLRNRVLALRGEDPLPTTTLLCHSMGGLVAKVFLHRVFGANARPRDVQRWMAQLITVATPFYGTANHMARYYKGQEPLNILYGTRTIARISGTLPGPYILMFLGRTIYDRDGVSLGLSRYPVRDGQDDNKEADPYDGSLRSRYPRWVRPEFLARARAMRHTLTRGLPNAVLARVFHIRSGQDRNTSVELRWEPVRGTDFDPDKDPSPITRGKKGPGDGTVPAWAARLAQTPDNQIYDLTRPSNRDHMELMEHPETLKVISFIVDRGRLPRSVTAPDETLRKPKASRAAVKGFFTDVAAGRANRDDPRATDEKIWHRILRETNLC